MIKKCSVCGCEFETKPSHYDRRKACSKKCHGIWRSEQTPWNKGKKCPSGERANHWEGGKIIDKYGYVSCYEPNHPFAVHGRYVKEHRLVMEKYLGRILNRKEIVHHKNGVKTDNRIQNLELTTLSEHVRHHKPRLGKPCSDKLKIKISAKTKEAMAKIKH